jgi:hypothetical protein
MDGRELRVLNDPMKWVQWCTHKEICNVYDGEMELAGSTVPPSSVSSTNPELTPVSCNSSLTSCRLLSRLDRIRLPEDWLERMSTH